MRFEIMGITVIINYPDPSCLKCKCFLQGEWLSIPLFPLNASLLLGDRSVVRDSAQSLPCLGLLIYLFIYFVFVTTAINAVWMIVSFVIEYLVSPNITLASKIEFAAFPYASTLRALTSISSPLVTNTTLTQRQNLSSCLFNIKF